MNDDVKPRSALAWGMGAAILAMVLAAAAWMNADPSWERKTSGGAAPAGAPAATGNSASDWATLPAATAASVPPAQAVGLTAPAMPTAAALKPGLPGAKAPDTPATDCKALVLAHGQAAATCTGQPDLNACVRQALQAQGLNADAYDLCKLFKPG